MNTIEIIEVNEHLQEKMDSIAKLLESHQRLENEPPLFTRSQVFEFMRTAQTLYMLTGKQAEDDELERIIP